MIAIKLLSVVLTVIQPGVSGYDPTAQAIAEQRVEYMAQHNYRWHPPGLNKVWKVARFEGAGWGRVNQAPHTIDTCRPRRRGMRLVADAFAVGRWGTFRIRLWR